MMAPDWGLRFAEDHVTLALWDPVEVASLTHFLSLPSCAGHRWRLGLPIVALSDPRDIQGDPFTVGSD
jgi:hypothetical protein